MLPPPVSASELSQKLQAQLKPTGWYDLLRLHVGSGDFSDIVAWLLDERKANRRFSPPLKLVLRPFEECPVDKLRLVVLVASPPHAGLGQADGLALSSPETLLPYATYQFVKALQQVWQLPGQPTGDLTHLARQGVLLLHQDLTTQLDRAGHPLEPHPWSSFHHAFLDVLTHKLPRVPVIFHQFPTAYLDEFEERPNTFFSDTPVELARKLQHVSQCFHALNEPPLVF